MLSQTLHDGRDAGGAKVEDQNAVLIDLDVEKPDGRGQVDREFIQQPQGVNASPTLSSGLADGICVSVLSVCRLQADAIVCRVKEQLERLRFAEPLKTDPVHMDQPLWIERDIEPRISRVDLATPHLLPIRSHNFKLFSIHKDCSTETNMCQV